MNFFTTNYDPLIELSLESLGVPFNDGFVGRGKPRFDPSAFSRLMCEQSLFMEYTSQVTTANVLKVHGSLTWRRVAVLTAKRLCTQTSRALWTIALRVMKAFLISLPFRADRAGEEFL